MELTIQQIFVFAGVMFQITHWLAAISTFSICVVTMFLVLLDFFYQCCNCAMVVPGALQNRSSHFWKQKRTVTL